METVHGQTTGSTPDTTTGHDRRMTCAGCGLVNDCRCAEEHTLLGRMMPLVGRLLGQLARPVVILDQGLVEELALLAELAATREREIGTIWNGTHTQDERDMLEEFTGHWGHQPSFLRTVEVIAARWKRPVEQVRGLLDSFLRESQPDPSAPPEPAPALRLCTPGERERCAGCGRVTSACLGQTDECRYRLLLAATRRLLVDGADPAKGSRTRERHRAHARKQMRAILAATDPKGPAARARETWPAWAQAVDAAVERRAA